MRKRTRLRRRRLRPPVRHSRSTKQQKTHFSERRRRKKRSKTTLPERSLAVGTSRDRFIWATTFAKKGRGIVNDTDKALAIINAGQENVQPTALTVCCLLHYFKRSNANLRHCAPVSLISALNRAATRHLCTNLASSPYVCL